MNLSWRIGRFFVVFGVGLIVLFGISDFAQTPRYNLFFWGLFVTVAGLLVMRRNRPAPVSSERFRMLKSLLARRAGKKRK